jgi:drug/metabolite transporter (DMT)-like permease
MMTALSRIPVVVAAPIGSLNPLIALILAFFLLKQMERITPRIIVGTALAVAGVVLVILGRNL